MTNTWAVLDFESSDQNKYSCKFDRVCISEVYMDTGELHNPQDFTWRPGGGDELRRRTLQDMMNKATHIVAHNAGFELHLLRRLGIQVKGEVHDTMLMAKAWRNDLPAYDLKSLSWWLFGDLYLPLTKVREWIHEHRGVGEDDDEFDMTKVPDRLVHDYCMHDIEATAKLASFLWPMVKDNYAYRQDAQLIPLVERMEDHGIQADVRYYERFTNLGKRRIRRNLHRAADEFGVDLQCRKPTGNALRDHLEARGERRRTAKGSVRADDVVLRDHEDSAGVRAVERVRTDQKQVNTYARNILSVVNSVGMFHPGLHQSSAITRRFRASGLYADSGTIAKGNVQNFPRGHGIRTGIIVPKGFKFVKMDLASIEPRLASHAMKTFLGFDFYCEKYKADDKFNMYLHVIKTCTDHGDVTKKDPLYIAYKHGCLGIQYGVGVDTFHTTMVEDFELPYSWDECNNIYKTIRSGCPEFSRLQRTVASIVESQGYIEDDFGSRYYVPEGAYKGVNYYCQGCAGNVLKWWWLEVDKLMAKTKDYSFLTVHDELDCAIWNDKQAKGRVKLYCAVLEGLDLFSLPIVAEASGLVDNWSDAG
jgi:DNA polymerase-1